MKRRFPKDVRYAPDDRLFHIWLSKGKRRIRRLERHESKKNLKDRGEE